MGARADAFDGPAHAADACLVLDWPRADVHDVCMGSCRCDASVGCCDVQCGAMRVDALGAVPPVQSW